MSVSASWLYTLDIFQRLEIILFFYLTLGLSDILAPNPSTEPTPERSTSMVRPQSCIVFLCLLTAFASAAFAQPSVNHSCDTTMEEAKNWLAKFNPAASTRH
jgi:hypothetical protein